MNDGRPYANVNKLMDVVINHKGKEVSQHCEDYPSARCSHKLDSL